MRSFPATFVVYISLTLSPPASVSSTCFVNSLSIRSATATSELLVELLVCIMSSYVHDSLPPIGGESNSGSTRSCRWEAESTGRAASIKCFVFGIGIGTGGLGGAGGLDVWRVGSRRW